MSFSLRQTPQIYIFPERKSGYSALRILYGVRQEAMLGEKFEKQTIILNINR